MFNMSVNSLKQGLEDNFKDYKDYDSSNILITIINRLNNTIFAISEFYGIGRIKIDIEPDYYGVLCLMISYPPGTKHDILQIEMSDYKYPIKLSSPHVPIAFTCNNIDELDSGLVYFFNNPHIKDF